MVNFVVGSTSPTTMTHSNDLEQYSNSASPVAVLPQAVAAPKPSSAMGEESDVERWLEDTLAAEDPMAVPDVWKYFIT